MDRILGYLNALDIIISIACGLVILKFLLVAMPYFVQILRLMTEVV